jgi:hypothetical protein
VDLGDQNFDGGDRLGDAVQQAGKLFDLTFDSAMRIEIQHLKSFLPQKQMAHRKLLRIRLLG